MPVVERSGIFYFQQYENRLPSRFINDSLFRKIVFQITAIIFLTVGLEYLRWRWTNSLNPNALWFAVPLLVAETLAFFGSVLIIINYWANKDPKPQPPLHYLSEIKQLKENEENKPISIDVFIATYNEDLELVRYTVRDAKQMTYPFDDVKINIYLLDDGRRDGRDSSKENFKKMAEEEGVKYFYRENNFGYKAGNLNHAFKQTNGDLIVILDADARPYPKFSENTTGYFRSRKLAWVQTPQWFYDLTEPMRVRDYLKIYKQSDSSDLDSAGLISFIGLNFGLQLDARTLNNQSAQDAEEKLTRELLAAYENKEKLIGPELSRNLERMVFLQIIDSKWKDHLYAMDSLREGIGLRAYGQKDPLIEYKREAFQMFSQMVSAIEEDAAQTIFKLEPVKPERFQGVFSSVPQELSHPEADKFQAPAVERGILRN